MNFFEPSLGLSLVVILVGILDPAPNDGRSRLVWDASNPHQLEWQIVNDSVMGGMSGSSITITNGVGRFEGAVSLENNGGFASIRTRPANLELPLNSKTFLIRVRGDGQSYKFTARRGGSMDGINYQLEFKPKAGEWVETRLPLSEFKASWRGRHLPEEPALGPKDVVSIGLLIASKKSGPFHLEIDWIKAVP